MLTCSRLLILSCLVACLLAACGAPVAPLLQTGAADLRAAAWQQTPDRYLCSVEHRENQALIKILDLQQQGVRKVVVPGRVKNLDGVQSEGKLYVSAIPVGSSEQALYEVQIHTGQVRRLLSFSQVGLNVEDFLIQNGKLYAVGVQNQRTALLSYDLKAYGWQPVVYDFQPGVLQYSLQNQDLQILHFGQESLTRTMVNLNSRQIYSINYAFNYKASENYLYSGIISRNGRYIFASINDKVQRYQLQDQMIYRLAPIILPHALPRYVALSQDGQQLYISHNQENRVSRVRFHSDGVTYRIEDLAFPGVHQELAVF